MPHTVKVLGLVSGRGTKIDGEYLKYYNPDGHEGLGEIQTTPNKEEALQFSSIADSIQYVQKVSRKYPIRYDGKPNRPLTAYNILVEKSV